MGQSISCDFCLRGGDHDGRQDKLTKRGRDIFHQVQNEDHDVSSSSYLSSLVGGNITINTSPESEPSPLAVPKAFVHDEAPLGQETKMSSDTIDENNIGENDEDDDEYDDLAQPLPNLKLVATIGTNSLLRSFRPKATRLQRNRTDPGRGAARGQSSRKLESEDDFIYQSLISTNNFIFASLSEHERKLFVDEMEKVFFSPGQVIIRRGRLGDFFYLVGEGTVSVYGKMEEGRRGDNVGCPIVANEIGDNYFLHKEMHGGERMGTICNADIADLSSSPCCGNKLKRVSEDFAISESDLMALADDSDHSYDGDDDDDYQDPRSARGQWRRSSLLASPDYFTSTSSSLEGVYVHPTNNTEDNTKNIRISTAASNESHVQDLKAGASFGELALLYNCPRAATCVARSNCTLYRIDRATFRRCMAGKKDGNDDTDSNSKRWSEHSEAVTFLKNVRFLRHLDRVSLSKLADVLYTAKFYKGDMIYRKGDTGDELFIVKKGVVKISDIGHGDSQHVDYICEKGDFFGESTVLEEDDLRVSNAIVESDEVELYVLSREQFEARLGPLQSLIDRSSRSKRLMSHPSFAGSVQRYEIEAIVKKARTTYFLPGHIIYSSGMKINPALYLIESGKVQIFDEDDNKVSTLLKGDHFGAESLQTGPAQVSKIRIEAIEETKCALIMKRSIEEVIGSTAKLNKPLPTISAKLDKSMRLEDLEKNTIVGVGSFGKVWLVRHKMNRTIHALKAIEKKVVLKNKARKNVMREKNIMASIDHPLIVNLVATFQNEHSLYMLMDFVQGGELFTLIHDVHPYGMQDNSAKFYASCILEALSYMHKRNIIHRDLKPENILVDSHGYCVIADLGFAKVVLDKTFTMCGTPEYLAPEIILGRGHDRMVDLWAFGAIIYELLVGQTPFIHPQATKQTLFRSIIREDFPFPDPERDGSYVPPRAQDLIRKVLAKNPQDRLGSSVAGSIEVRRHVWFDNAPEGHVLRRKVAHAPWVPQIEDSMDSHHFHSYAKIERAEGLRWSQKADITTAEQELFVDF